MTTPCDNQPSSVPTHRLTSAFPWLTAAQKWDGIIFRQSSQVIVIAAFAKQGDRKVTSSRLVSSTHHSWIQPARLIQDHNMIVKKFCGHQPTLQLSI